MPAGSAVNACTLCRKRRVKCVLDDISASVPRCARCIKHNLSCEFTARKPTGRPIGSSTKRKQMPDNRDTPVPTFAAPLGLADGGDTEGGSLYRYAPRGLFQPKFDLASTLDPINLGLLSLAEAERLFQVYFTHVHTYNGCLDASLHTVTFVRSRSMFLLSVIILVAARHDGLDPRSPQIARATQQHIDNVIWPACLLQGLRSTQLCQALQLLGSFTQFRPSSETDAGWALFGHSLRMAVELGLQRPMRAPSSREEELAMRDAQRVNWTLFIADASWAALTGRAPVWTLDSTLAERTAWLESPLTTPEDRSICGLIEYRLVLQRERNNGQGPPSTALRAWRDQWVKPGNGGRMSDIGQIYFDYGQLLLAGYQLARGRSTANFSVIDLAVTLISSALALPQDVVNHMHDNGIMMILYPCRLLHRLRHSIPATDREPILDMLNQMYVVLHTAGSTPIHKQGGEAATAAEHLGRSLTDWQDESSELGHGQGSSSVAGSYAGSTPAMSSTTTAAAGAAAVVGGPFIPPGPLPSWSDDPLAFDDSLAAIYLDLFQESSDTFAFDPFMTF